MTQLTGYTIYGTYTTAKGTPFTVYSTPVGVDVCLFAVADAKAQTANLHAVLYCHGSGGNNDQFTTLSAFKIFRETIIDNGGVYVEAFGSTVSQFQGRYGWGRVSTHDGYVLPMQAVMGILSILDIVVVGRSMGGLIGKWLVSHSNALTSKIIAYMDVSGIYDMMANFDNGNYFDLPGYYSTPEPAANPDTTTGRTIRDVIWDSGTSRYRLVTSGDGQQYTDWTNWTANSTTVSARSALVTATAALDPKRFSSTAFTGLNVYVTIGTSDPTAINIFSGLEFWNDFHTTFGTKSKLTQVPGATHDPPGTYTDPGLSSFLINVWGLTPPDPVYGNIYQVVDEGQVMPDGSFHYLSHGTY